MSTVYVWFPDIAGDVSGYTIFLRDETTGALLNTGGDAITEIATGLWSFTLGETRPPNKNYLAAIYSGTTETTDNLVYADMLRAGMDRVAAEFEPTSKTVIMGTVGNATTPSTSSFTPSALSTEATVANQWRGRVLIFNNHTSTAALRGQATLLEGSSAAALPLLTFVALTTAPANGDTFTIV
ncbi:MAG: hypothetical protein E6R03_04535 [Hyphomicrobiaceae bacterium]|nr:MAG: hypothetical protein E6R03_04535 [Hyphomicrobiaceae bacterium]